ncbi:MAG: histidine kinase [Hyphomicrobiaceae bacterium]|nr:histidine kinase [Hyphomicrobiaceae bacterium]
MSLRLRLIRTVALVLLAVLALGALLTYWHAQHKIELELSSGLSVAESTARLAVDDAARAADPREGLRRVVHAFDGNRHVRAALLDPDGREIDTSQVLAPDEEAPEWLFGILTQPVKLVRIPLPGALTKYGMVLLESDQRSETAEVWGDMQLSLTTLTSFCALVLVLIYWTLGRALQPFAALSHGFERVGKGDYTARVPETGAVELAALCANFNVMAGALGRSEERNFKLNEQLTTVQEEERTELARDLHDEVSPLLFSIDVDARAIRKSADETSPAVVHSDAILDAVGQIKSQVKSILGRLRPAVLLDLGLSNAIENLVAYWQARRPEIDFVLDLPEESWGTALDATIHGVVREALSNAMQHSEPTKLEISVSANDGGMIVVRVADDGGGLSKPSGEEGSFGLLHMRERIVAKGGRFAVENRSDGRGVTVTAELPLPKSPSIAAPPARTDSQEALAS